MRHRGGLSVNLVRALHRCHDLFLQLQFNDPTITPLLRKISTARRIIPAPLLCHCLITIILHKMLTRKPGLSNQNSIKTFKLTEIEMVRCALKIHNSTIQQHLYTARRMVFKISSRAACKEIRSQDKILYKNVRTE